MNNKYRQTARKEQQDYSLKKIEKRILTKQA